jgi:hypothetical protein
MMLKMHKNATTTIKLRKYIWESINIKGIRRSLHRKINDR